MMRLACFLLICLWLAVPCSTRALDPATLPAVGYHASGISYWDTPMFANALHQGGTWIEFAPFQWGSTVSWWNSPQFDARGYPQYLNEGLALRALTFGLHVNIDNRPPTWPNRYKLAQGRVVLEWQGEADIRLSAGGTYLAADSSGAATGSLVDGRRVYRYSGGAHLQWLEVHAINPANPITDIKVWLADPADPDNASLEGQVWHPTFLDRIREAEWGFVRTMNLQSTNANPQQDWSDRRSPNHAFMTGIVNPRAPATGSPGNRETGMALEQMIALCNETQRDLWICLPHLATDDYIRRTAQMILFGSDGVDPYEELFAEPVWAPLDPGLRVYVEYSNEIWASGYSFPQGDWAQEQATAAGISKAQWNARRFCEVWNLFEEVFGDASRLVRVAAIFSAADWYSTPFLQEIAAYGPTLDPPVEPDVIAVTTYFSNGIQDWAHEQAIARAPSPDPWFYTTDTFPVGASSRPVSKPANDPYWVGSDIERHLDETFVEWTRRLLSGDAREGGGPDAVGIGGGFGNWVRDLAEETFPTPKPVVAYEGGPSIYTDYMDAGDPRDDGITTFMEALNRHPAMRDVYRLHLNMAEAKGLHTHVMFTDSGRWGKYGQWGHLEYIDQPNEDAPKYQFLLDWIDESALRRHVDDPAGAGPSFVTPHNLPTAIYDEPYEATIDVAGGDGALAIEVIGSLLAEGLAFDPMPGEPNRVRVHGTPAEAGLSYVYLRVCDEDGDCAWRTFNARTVGGPHTILEVDFTGANPSGNLPWTSTYVLHPDVAWGGVLAGSGIIAQNHANALAWSVNAPQVEANATLALAMSNNQYLAFTLTPEEGKTLDLAGHEMRFTIRRLSYHAPRRYVVFTDVEGFTPGAEVFHTARFADEDDHEFAFTFPDDDAYRHLVAPVTVRLYGYSAQWGGHATSLRALRVDGALATPSGVEEEVWRVR